MQISPLLTTSRSAHPTDTYAQADLGDHSRKVNERVCALLSALQAGSVGTQACINAVATVSGIVGDLDTTIMFATAATLNADENDSFGDHRLVGSGMLSSVCVVVVGNGIQFKCSTNFLRFLSEFSKLFTRNLFRYCTF